MRKSNISQTKKFVLILVLCGPFAFSQTVEVKQQDQKINSKKSYGFATVLDAPSEEVVSALTRFLKTYGKPKVQSSHIQIAETTLNGQSIPKPVYALVKPSGQNASAWIGINLEEWAADSSKITTQLESMVKTFGVNFYCDKIQAQIDEAQQAVDAVDRQQQRTQNENRTITNRTENNRSEYQSLRMQMQRNRADSAALLLRFHQNLRTADSLRMVSEKVKKALEFQKERQRKVN